MYILVFVVRSLLIGRRVAFHDDFLYLITFVVYGHGFTGEQQGTLCDLYAAPIGADALGIVEFNAVSFDHHRLLAVAGKPQGHYR